MEQHLPKLEPVVQLPYEGTHLFAKTKSYQYYKALHDLKEVTHQLTTVNNRIKILTSKQQQATHPIADYFQQRGKRLRSFAKESNEKSQEDLQKIKQKEQQMLSRRHLRNEESKRENTKRKEKAKRVIAEEKYKSHDSVRQCSLQNSKNIQNARMKALHKKKQQFCEVAQFEKKSRSHIRQLSLSRISRLVEEREAETNKILNKLKQKQRMLVEKKEECFVKEASLEKMISAKKKPRRVYQRRLFTQQTKSTVLFGTDASGTPKSALSFVIIP